MVKCHKIVTFRGCHSIQNFRLSLFWFLVTRLSKFSKCHFSLSNLCHQCHKFVTSLLCCINYWYILKLIVLVQSLEALFEGQFKIESCKVGIFNTVDELVKLEHKDWSSSIFISVSGVRKTGRPRTGGPRPCRPRTTIFENFWTRPARTRTMTGMSESLFYRSLFYRFVISM